MLAGIFQTTTPQALNLTNKYKRIATKEREERKGRLKHRFFLPFMPISPIGI
jgi:hypothetical protein